MDFRIPGANIRVGQEKKWIHNVEKDLGSLRLKTAEVKAAQSMKDEEEPS